MGKPPRAETTIEAVIKWIGSIPSIIFHSAVFVCLFVLTLADSNNRSLILLVWNTMVSLEAIYLAIFIQFTVNRNTESLRGVAEDIDEIQEDVEELGEDVDEIQEDIEEISEDFEEMQEDLGEMQEDIEEMSEDDIEDEKRDQERERSIDALTSDIRKILVELEAAKTKVHDQRVKRIAKNK